MSESSKRPLWIYGVVPVIATLVGLWSVVDVNAPFYYWSASTGLIVVCLTWLGFGCFAYADWMHAVEQKVEPKGY